MTWAGSSNAELVNQLQNSKVFHSDLVRKVMSEVDRADFISQNPYVDLPQSIGYGATISAPHMHAAALEGLLDVIKPDSHILDVGSGSGYLTTCFAKLLGLNGKVVGIDHIAELVEMSERNVRKHHSDLLDSGKIKFVVGDGREGYEAEGPYDAIHVGAAASEMPQSLVDQLSLGGRMLIPVGKQNQEFVSIERLQNGSIQKRILLNVIYVPLTDRELQLNGRNR